MPLRKRAAEALAWAIRLLLVVSGIRVIADALSALVPGQSTTSSTEDSAANWPSKPSASSATASDQHPLDAHRPAQNDSFECSQCGKPNAILRCGRCKNSRYCSQQCQKAAWPLHKNMCSKAKPSKKQQHNAARSRTKRRGTRAYGSFKERVESLEPDSDDELEDLSSADTPSIKNDGVSRGKLFLTKGEPKNALEQLLLVLNDRTESMELKGEAAFLAAYASHSLGNAQDAEQYLDSTVGYADELGKLKLREEAALARGNFLRRAGKVEEAQAHLSATAERLKTAVQNDEANARDVLAIALSGAGELEVQLGRASEGADRLKEAVATRMEQWNNSSEESDMYESLRGLAMCAVNHGAALLAAGRRSDAIEPYEIAMSASEEVMALEVHYRALTALIHLAEEYNDEKVTERTTAFLSGLHDMLTNALDCEDRRTCVSCGQVLVIESEEAAYGDTKVLPMMCTHMLHRGCAKELLPKNGGDGKCPAEGCTNTNVTEEIDAENAFAANTFEQVRPDNSPTLAKAAEQVDSGNGASAEHAGMGQR